MAIPKRELYRRAELDRVLNPRSIAIVGASTRSGSFGERLLANLGDFDGNLYLVNSKYERLGERPCYPSLKALPVVPDCVAVTVPRDAAEPVIVEAADVGAGGVILYASGYAETGQPQRVAEQARLTQIARERGLRILGPNCLGIANYARRARITFSIYPEPRAQNAPAVGIASQSGALSQALAQAMECGASVSHAFSAGNQCDVDVADLVAYLAEDTACRSIACVFEGMSDPERLLEASELAWRADKPLLIHKVATGALGAQAAMSHTGSLAGSDSAYRAAFARAGVIQIDNFEGLMEAAAFFAKAPPPKAKGVAVVATSGGAGIMAADKAELHGVPLPQPKDSVRQILEQHIPDFGSARNPCDVTAQVVNNPQSLWACGEAVMSDDAYGAIVMPQPLAFDLHVPRISAFSLLSERFGKVTCNVLISGWLQGPASSEAEMDPRVAQFRSMDRCFATLAAWHHRDERRRAPPRKLVRNAPAAAAEVAASLIRKSDNKTLTEREAKAVLAAYGIPTVPEQLVSSAEQAAKAAAGMGFPVALKVESPDIPHKTEAGVIRLNLTDDATTRQAFEAVMANARRAAPAARINGVLVQPMIPAGIEIIIGGRIDPQLGPLILVGQGGVLVEVLQDTALELAPVTTGEGVAMLERLKSVRLLRGFRGSAPVDLQRLGEIVSKASELLVEQRALLAELDINPLICSGGKIVAVDALISRTSDARPTGHGSES
jgi:acyl-CoA synthetase (NDP forming)